MQSAGSAILTSAGARRALRALEILAWTLLLAFALLVLALRYWLLPNVAQYRADVVAVLERSVGLPVRIGALEAGWQGLRPRLELTDVRVADAQGREALALPAVTGVVAWRSLLVGKLRLHRLEIAAPRLAVRRDRAGALYVAGMKLGGGADDGRFTDWVLAQHDVVVRDAEIDWHDELRGAPPLALARLQFHLQNDGDEHSAGVSAEPPEALGARLELRAELIGRSAADPSAWTGRVYAELGATDLAGWRPWLDYPLDLRRGQGALRLWADLGKGELQRVAADVELSGVVAHAAAGLPALELRRVRGRLEGLRGPRGYEFAARRLALEPVSGPKMSSSTFRVAWEPAAAGAPERGAVSADLIELEPVAHLAEALPFPAELRKLITELAPRGDVRDLRFDWRGALPGAAEFRARARFAGLAMNAWKRVPGFSGLSGSLEANAQRGTLFLASQKSSVELPRVLPEPRVALDALTGQVEWEVLGGGAEAGVAVKIARLAFANEHLAGSAHGSWRGDASGPGVIDLSATLTRADGRHVARYLPLGSILGPKTRRYLEASILAGRGSDGQLRLKGDLRDFPFVDPAKGVFQVSARFTQGVFDYADGWPRVFDIQGELLFERERMEIVARSATILGARVSNVRVGSPNLRARETLLKITGHAEGPAQEFLKYIEASPVRRMTDAMTDGMSATGRGRLELGIDLILEDLSKTRVAGSFQFQNNAVRVSTQLPPIERVAGRLSFTESGVTLHDLAGRLLGGPVTLSGGSGAPAGVQVVARGQASAEGFGALIQHPWSKRLSGTLAYTATVSAQGPRTRIRLDSDLRGAASALPPPLAKSAADALPLRLEILPGEGGSRDRVSVALPGLQAEFLRRRQASDMSVERAAVRFGKPAEAALRVPERPGLLVYGELDALDLDRWRPLLGGDSAAGGAAQFDLKIGALDFYGKRVNRLALRGGADALGWSATLEAAELAGSVGYRSEKGGTLTAKLQHFRIPEDAPRAGAGPEARPAARPSEMPAVDLVAERFGWRDKALGRVEIAARPAGAEWRIEKLRLLNPEASLEASGVWQTAPESRTTLKFRLAASDAGKFLERLGYPDRIRRGNGTLEGSLAWAAEPAAFDWPTLRGGLNLELDEGEIPQLDTGLGRLLSLFSLQLSDVFAKGFQFAKMSGSGRIESGVLRTSDFKMTGSSAEVLMSGSVDLARETQDLKARVTPSVRRSVATLVGIANPAVGVATAIVQNVLKDPLGQILAYEYAVGGTWDKPALERLGAQPVDAPPPGAPPSPQQ